MRPLEDVLIDVMDVLARGGAGGKSSERKMCGNLVIRNPRE